MTKRKLLMVDGIGYNIPAESNQNTVKDQWIKVEDRLPKQATFVIAYKENGLVLGLYFNADHEFKYGEQDQTNQVTHWMPLPQPPKQSEK